MANYSKDDEMLYHIGLTKKMLNGAKYALLPGDPGRVELIARSFPQFQPLADHREYTSWLCHEKDMPILVCSTGMGGPSLAICLEELARLGVTHFIRVGTTGAIQDKVALGDVIINNSAIRLDGTSTHYAPLNYPAVACFNLTRKLVESAEEVKAPYHMGIAVSSDTFWPGQERYDSFTGYVLPQFQGSLAMWKQLNALNCEMETATLFVVAKTFGLHAASICGTVALRGASEQPAGKDVYDLAQGYIQAVLRNMFCRIALRGEGK